jgi:uncharacterized protein with FMN-binding domain
MRRTPIVLTATVAGLAGVLAFHTSPAHLGALPVASDPTGNPTTGGGTSSNTPASTGNTPTGNGTASTTPKTTPNTTPKPAATTTTPKPTSSGTGLKTVDGPSVNYSFGVLSVAVTVNLTTRKITKVGIASLEDDGSPRSEMIDQQAIPVLEQEALQAQSANIQSVSGASFTSSGFQQSLQGALHTLGLA